jgi:hypothetical protein
MHAGVARYLNDWTAIAWPGSAEIETGSAETDHQAQQIRPPVSNVKNEELPSETTVGSFIRPRVSNIHTASQEANNSLGRQPLQWN